MCQMTKKELRENITWETGIKTDEKKFNEYFEKQENKKEILKYQSEQQIKFIEEFLQQ